MALQIAGGSAVDWAAQIRRFRRNYFVKQVALANSLGIDQATVSRWERGVSVPDLSMQRRLQEAMSYKRCEESLLKYCVNSALGQIVLSSVGRVIFAASEAYHHEHGVPPGAMIGQSTRPMYTEEGEQLWQAAHRYGFFCGDLAAVTVILRAHSLSGHRRNIPVKVVWTPVRLPCGQILLRGERVTLTDDEFGLALARNGGPMRIVTMGDLSR